MKTVFCIVSGVPNTGHTGQKQYNGRGQHPVHGTDQGYEQHQRGPYLHTHRGRGQQVNCLPGRVRGSEESPLLLQFAAVCAYSVMYGALIIIIIIMEICIAR